WGANAVNGVINIITKNSRDTQGTLATALSGRVDRFNGTVREGLHYGANFDYRFFVHGFLREPEINPGFDPYDRWHMVHGGFRADWTPTRRDTFSAEGGIYTGQSGLQVGLGVYSPLEQIPVDGSQAVSGGNLTLHWHHQFQRDSDLRVEAYFDRTNRQGPQFGETRNTFDVDVIDHFLWLKRQDIIWGAGVRLSPSHFIQSQPTVDFEPHNQNDYIYSTFFQDTAHLVPGRLNLTLGTKLEYNNFSRVEYQPTARLLWNPSVHSTLWGSFSRAVRTPGRLDQDLQLTGVATANPPFILRIEGDPTFKSEVLVGYEAGYRQLLTHSLYADVATFYNRYDKLESYGNISFSTITSPIAALLLNVPYANGIDGVTDGIEIAPDWKPTPWWELKGNFSHLHIQTQPRPGYSDTATAASYNGSSPHREATVQSYLDFPHGIDLDLDYRFVSALPAQTVKSYQTGDARIGWKIGRQWELSVAGRNLFQPSHGEFIGDDANAVSIRRSVYAGLTWTR
ncbi:MAG: TonB-dependent receptor plug domain-containing protein, partial [Terracidiphilus sp.]